MVLSNVEFKRKFSLTLYKDLHLKMGEMSMGKDFVTTDRGDLYPVLGKSEDCCEAVEFNRYIVKNGWVKRWMVQFFPYASYEMTAEGGKAGFCFGIPGAEASVLVEDGKLLLNVDGKEETLDAPAWLEQVWTMVVTCGAGVFSVYFVRNGKPEHFHTVKSADFAEARHEDAFTNGYAAVYAQGNATVHAASSYMDCGLSQADMRPIRYEDGEIIQENGKIYLTMSIRMQCEMIQGIFSWVPGTAEFDLTGVLCYDIGDGKWCADVAVTMLYHRGWKKWLYWMCAFSHGHTLAYGSMEGDPRFGVNVADVTLMEVAKAGTPITEFASRQGDEDPNFFYDAEQDKWLMAICRLDHETNNGGYRYVFFESKDPFTGYKYIGMGYADGAETGGSFVKVKGEQLFICGNDFRKKANYRIYSKEGMEEVKFDLPDGGFRGWGTLLPVVQGSRKRYYFITFDRHNGSELNNWSYGNLYIFEGKI